MDFDKCLQFVREIDKLKQIQRKTLNYHEARRENSAEHSWHLGLAVLSLAAHANRKDLDLLKALKIALLHDIVEIDAGDIIVYDDSRAEEKFSKEKQAAERLFGLLPQELGDEFKSLWYEYEHQESAEAQFVGALDRFLPLYSNCLNHGHSWKEFQISKEQVLAKNQSKIERGSQTLWQFAEAQLKAAEERGELK